MSSLKNASIARERPRTKLWMTSGEVARELNMTDAAIRRWAREGLVDAIKTPGGQYRFRREDLNKLFQNVPGNGASRARAARKRS
jgi:excisionase family DNA binding protein